MDTMQASGDFEPPVLASLETVLDETIRWKQGRVFADLWDIEQFATCGLCLKDRTERLRSINLTQTPTVSVHCSRCQDVGE